MKYYDHFLEKLDKLVTDEDIKFLKTQPYHEKKKHLDSKIKQIIQGESREFIGDVVINKDEYLTELVCQWSRLYTPLTPDQKLLVLVNLYNAYIMYDDKSRVYLSHHDFLRAVDTGTMYKYWVSSVGLVTDYMRDLPNLSPSDVLFWLQHEWKDLSGDWFEKLKGKEYLSRNTNRFTPRTYQAFNEIFKQAIGRELRCFDQFRNITMLDTFKEAVK